jgi:DNA-binding response OmpR family regulator
VSTGPPILLVLSDRPLGHALARELGADGFGVELARTAEHARRLALRRPPSLALLGPLGCGSPETTLLREIRACAEREGSWDSALPVLVLGLEAGRLEALRALDAGADDFMAVPFAYLELRARLRAILRRASAAPTRRLLRAGSLQIDLDARRACLRDRELELCRIEFDLLAHLARDPGRVFTREDLLLSVWGYPAGATTRTLDTHASSLRRKLAMGSDERWIAGVRGIGYRLI